MSNPQNHTITKPVFTVPFVDKGYDNASPYSLEKVYEKLKASPNIKPTYHDEESLIVRLGTALEQTEGIQAIASTLYLASQNGAEIKPALLEKLAISIAHLGYEAAYSIGMAQEAVRLDFNKAMGIEPR